MYRIKAHWRTWDEPDRDVAIAYWIERDVAVVFPLDWAKKYGQKEMIGRAKDRIKEVEMKAGGKTLVEGSVLVAFSRHEEKPDIQTLNPEVRLGSISGFPIGHQG